MKLDSLPQFFLRVGGGIPSNNNGIRLNSSPPENKAKVDLSDDFEWILPGRHENRHVSPPVKGGFFFGTFFQAQPSNPTSTLWVIFPFYQGQSIGECFFPSTQAGYVSFRDPDTSSIRDHFLTGGFKYLFFSPLLGASWSNLTSIFFRWVCSTTNQNFLLLCWFTKSKSTWGKNQRRPWRWKSCKWRVPPETRCFSGVIGVMKMGPPFWGDVLIILEEFPHEIVIVNCMGW